jgi:hypothetical protein
MKRILVLSLMFATLVLVVVPLGKSELALKDSPIENLQGDLISIDDVNFEPQTEVTNPINVVEVEISPGDNLQGVYYSEFSKDNNSHMDGFLALYAINDYSYKRTQRLYGTNYFTQSIWLNSDLATTPNTATGTNKKDYTEVGISPALSVTHQYDA